MQDQENEFVSPDSDNTPDPNIHAEPVEIFPESEKVTQTEGFDSDSKGQTPPSEEETRTRRFFRKAIRWTAGLLVVFGLGFLAAVFTIYDSKVDELAYYRNNLDTAEDTITDLMDQVSDLENQIVNLNRQIEALNQEIDDLEAQNQALLADQDSFHLHIALLKARSDVVSAQVEIYAGNLPQARVLLQNTDQTLTSIETLLPDDLKDVINPLRTRLELAISEIDTDPETAIEDLAILAGDLLEIENALFED